MGFGLRALGNAGRWLGARLPHHRLDYWLTALVILVVATWAMPYLDARLDLTRERSWLFEHLAQTPTNKALAGRARLVLIGDQEVWVDIPQQKPSDIAYMAQVVRALDKAEASVIAL